ncbi:MAG TPA: tyrosine-type recombinase/integrase [Candidatus Methylomirabilis sp.]|nr:tyrosine-type recombinase/integrase [Candidatus Methylomirabilis sp.]
MNVILMELNDLKNDPRIVQWFNLKDSSKGTQKTYLGYMKKFCECVGKTPTEIIREAEDETRKGLLLSERNTIVYITKFKQCIRELAPKSQALGMATINSFYENFDIPLSSSVKKQRSALPKKENQNFLKREDVENLITHAQNLRDKAIFLCMATSGMGKQEITNLRMSDITFGGDGISTISIRRQKANRDLITFISPEATQALKIYIDERNRDPELAVKGKNDLVFITYINAGRYRGGKGGIISERGFTKIFRDLGKKLGYGNGDDYVKSRSHALRKFFTSTLEGAGFPKAKVDFMVGHAVNGVDFAYYFRDPAELKELYIKYLQHITFFDKEIEVRSLDTKDTEDLNRLKIENEELKSKITQLEEYRNETQQVREREKSVVEKVMQRAEEQNKKFEAFLSVLDKDTLDKINTIITKKPEK